MLSLVNHCQLCHNITTLGAVRAPRRLFSDQEMGAVTVGWHEWSAEKLSRVGAYLRAAQRQPGLPRRWNFGLAKRCSGEHSERPIFPQKRSI
jgi:hypothetical protein